MDGFNQVINETKFSKFGHRDTSLHKGRTGSQGGRNYCYSQHVHRRDPKGRQCIVR